MNAENFDDRCTCGHQRLFHEHPLARTAGIEMSSCFHGTCTCGAFVLGEAVAAVAPRPTVLRPGSEQAKMAEARNETDAGGMWRRLQAAIRVLAMRRKKPGGG